MFLDTPMQATRDQRVMPLSGRDKSWMNKLKVWAMACMVFDHLTWLYNLHRRFASTHEMVLWRTPGRFSMPLFALLLGVSITLLSQNPRKMLIRLTWFALLSQPFYNLYFGAWDGMNAIWSLALGAWMLSWIDCDIGASLRWTDHAWIALMLTGSLDLWWLTSGWSLPAIWRANTLIVDLAYALSVPWVGWFARRGVLHQPERWAARLVMATGFFALTLFFNGFAEPFALVMAVVAGSMFFFPWCARFFGGGDFKIRARNFFYYFYPLHIICLYFLSKI